MAHYHCHHHYYGLLLWTFVSEHNIAHTTTAASSENCSYAFLALTLPLMSAFESIIHIVLHCNKFHFFIPTSSWVDNFQHSCLHAISAKACANVCARTPNPNSMEVVSFVSSWKIVYVHAHPPSNRYDMLGNFMNGFHSGGRMVFLFFINCNFTESQWFNSFEKLMAICLHVLMVSRWLLMFPCWCEG